VAGPECVNMSACLIGSDEDKQCLPAEHKLDFDHNYHWNLTAMNPQGSVGSTSELL